MAEVKRPSADRSWGPAEVTLILAGTCTLGGVLIGASGPFLFIAVGPGIVAGPTWGGIVLLGGLLIGALSLVGGLVAMVIGHGGRFFGAVFLCCLGLTAGIFGGTALGRATGFGDWAPDPTAGPMPSFPFATAAPVYRANGVVTLEIDDVAAFAQPSLEPFGDGLFGHWCASDPNAKTLSTIETIEVGRIGGRIVRADLRLSDPGGDFARWSVAIPRLTITVADERGEVFDAWSGPGVVVESSAASGRLTFTGLAADPGYRSGLLPVTISGRLSWQCGAWQAPN
jgi:hypothetical protein